MDIKAIVVVGSNVSKIRVFQIVIIVAVGVECISCKRDFMSCVFVVGLAIEWERTLQGNFQVGSSWPYIVFARDDIDAGGKAWESKSKVLTMSGKV